MLPEMMTHKIKSNTTCIKGIINDVSFFSNSFFRFACHLYQAERHVSSSQGWGDRDKHDTLEQGEITSPEF